MATPLKKAATYISGLFEKASLEELSQRLMPRPDPPIQRVPRGASQADMLRRLDVLNLTPEHRSLIAGEESVRWHDRYSRNIENYIGTVRIPVGIAGPLRVNGLHANGDFFIPLATTEAALVASYNRGARAVSLSGGCTALLLSEGVGRAPGFVFRNLREAGTFAAWANDQFMAFKKVCSRTTGHGRLEEMRTTIEGNHVYLLFEYSTGDASGQNMVTIATQEICSYILEQSPIKPLRSYVEANLSGDKKASFQSFHTVRGKKVSAEATIPAGVVRQILRTTPSDLAEYWRISAIGGSLSGTIGMQGHYANGLAALYIACGQDVACVAESAVGLTRLEQTGSGDLYAAVTLPNLMVGTVGGGTGLPTQQACLSILGLAGSGNVRAFAEVAASLCLVGELSIMAALAAGDFSKAHQILARGRKSAKQDT